MKELIKKGFYLGIGAASLTKEKIDKELKPLARKYKLGQVQTRQLAGTLLSAAKKENRKLVGRISNEVRKVARGLGYRSSAEVKKLKARIKFLESRVEKRGRSVVSRNAQRFAGGKKRGKKSRRGKKR